MKTVVFDIETNGLYYDTTTVHCMSVKVNDEPTLVYTSRPIQGSAGSIQDGLDVLATADLLVGHNIINFDLPVLKKLHNFQHKTLYDTMIASQLGFVDLFVKDAKRKNYPSNLIGSHSLKAWGYRLRKYKGDFGSEENSWEHLTKEMVEYCRQDSEVTYSLYNKLLTAEIPPAALEVEQEFAIVISRQEKYGVLFDLEKAQKLHIELLQEKEKATATLHKVFTPLKDWVPLNRPVEVNKNGTPNKNYQAQIAKGAMYNDELQWGYYKEVVFNPSSRQHIARWLTEVYNWKPVDFTEKGTPIVNEEVLSNLDFEEGKILAHYFNVNKLIGQLSDGDNSWMSMVDKNNRIHGRVNTLGAVSRRCTHSKPNMAQVPSTRAYKGHEARELFCVPKGYKLVGCDADGLELRTLSHYMAKHDGGQYATAVDEGKKENGTDIHTLNKRGAGLPTRDAAKTFIYAFLYGAGDEKIGSIVGGNSADGKRLKDKFFKQIPAIKQLVETVKAVYKKNKHLKAIDGNKYYIRSEHSALNTLLQGAGAIVMKYYLVQLDKNLAKHFTNSSTDIKPDYEFVLNVHDEVQIECKEEIAERVARIAETTFDDVTATLAFRIPLRGSAAIGNNWADTH